MIEMRWIVVPAGSGRGLLGGEGGQMIENVLQYRYREFQEGFVPGLGGYGKWSEWQDAQTPAMAMKAASDA